MKSKTFSLIILLIWAALTAALWFGPRETVSDSERRPLAQMPEINLNTVVNGKFMADFEDFTLDQFPLRDSFRTLKSLFHQYVLGHKDNNGIYLHDGYAAKMEYPLNQVSLNHAAERFNHLYEKYLSDSDVYMAIVPDKGYYLAEESGHMALDYEALFSFFREKLPWAIQIDLTDTLQLSDYYRTDTHWRQENLAETASKLLEAMGKAKISAEDFIPTTVEKPFYGVYYGQAALPMEPDSLVVMQSDILSDCTVYDHETGKTTAVYDMEKLQSKDLYDIFLSGAKPLLTIENPNAENHDALIVFRDSFGSSMIPLLASQYAKITVIDIRYIAIDLLDRFVEFKGQDVLFLYSTLVLNSSDTIR